MVRINSFVAVILFGALTAVVSLQVLNRMILHLPIIWSEEVARFLFFWVVLLGAALGVRKRRHFVLDLSMGRKRAGRSVVRFLSDAFPQLCVLGFAVFLLIQGVGYARTGLFRSATNSGINMVLVYAAIPVFAALTIAYAVANLRSDYLAFRHGQPPVHRPAAAK